MTNIHASDGAAESTRSMPLVRIVVRIAAALAWTVLALVAYFICQGMFGGYPRLHSQLLTTLGMIGIALTGGIAWIVDERRPHDDD
jgi:hypothetical protein